MDNVYTCNEDLEAQREREAGRTFSAFCLRENGDSRHLVTETPIEFLNAAHLLRLCLQDGHTDATAYARRIPGGCASSREQFEKLLQARLDNTGRAAGVFELDFDRQVFSAVQITDGWKSYWFRDISAAACRAFRKENCKEDLRLEKFLARLEGHALTAWDTSPTIHPTRNISSGDLAITGTAGHIGRLLTFLAACEDPSLFHLRERPGDHLDLFVSYDVVRQEVRDRMDLLLHRTDGGQSKARTCFLSPEEQAMVRGEMEGFCMRIYGQTLNERCMDLYFHEAAALPRLDRGSQRLDVSALSFEGDTSECGGKMDFYVPVTFDPDTVFGTNVTTEANDDWIDVYAGYDLETGEPEPDLTIILACGDRSEFAFSYPLTEREREQLRERMEAYCQAQTGKSLAEYREELLSDGSEMAPGANMGMEM